MWENLFVSQTYQIGMGLIFLAFCAGYCFLCYYAIQLANFYLIAVKFRYHFTQECSEIETQFTQNQDLYHQYALQDRDFLWHAQTNGIY